MVNTIAAATSVSFTVENSGLAYTIKSILAPFFAKLGLPAVYFYFHSCFVYLGLILAAIAIAVVVVQMKKQQKTRKRRPNPVKAAAMAAEAPATEESSETADPRILAAVHQHIGSREDQQDSYGVSEPTAYTQNGVMAVVADGMGGLANGRAVSSTLVRTLLEGFRSSNPRQNPADFLLEQAVRANSSVNQLLRGQDRSGSTLVSCVVRRGYMHFLTVGDSRIYLYRGGALIQLNREHIYQEELATKAVNQLTSLQQVRGDRQAHSLTSYFGIGKIPAIDRNDEGLKLLSGDKILLASDGVFGTLTQAQMEAALAQDVSAAAKTMGELIRQANRAHQDNNTAVILEYRV